MFCVLSQHYQYFFNASWSKSSKELKNGIEILGGVKKVVCYEHETNWPVSYATRHQRPARERHKIRIASRENVDNQTPRNTNFTH